MALLAAGCAGDAGEVATPNNPPGANNPPTASAGADQDVTRGSMVTLMGSAADPDGQSLTFTWTQVSGPSVGTLTGGTPTFIAPNEVTTLEFDLVTSDGRESSAADRVIVWVLEDAAHALWVAPDGNDANPGTRASPKLTIQAAINASSDGADVYLTAGTWDVSATITLRAGVGLYGGFDATTFLRDPAANETVITGPSTAISGTGANALTIDGLTIRSADGIATDPEANRSSVGIAFQNSDDVAVTRNRILTGNGIVGAQGTLPPFPETGGHGGLGAGSSGGSGGSGGVVSRPGGNGGDGGGSFAGVCTSGGATGGSGLGPSPGLGGAGNDSDGNGGNGGHGLAGINGLNASGSAQSFGSVAAGAYVPAPGGNGGPGTNGSSGGGGGGGDCLVVGFLTAVHGGGGGGGGGAGAGRGGSGGGRGGGASLGILVTGQSTGLFIADNVIITGDGGTGGQGTSGSLGSAGGGGSPGARVAANGTLGGHGGNGGYGGGGGAGGGGGGGPTVGVVVDATSATNLSSSDLAGNVITLGVAGLGGAGGYGTNEQFAPSGADGLRAEVAVNP